MASKQQPTRQSENRSSASSQSTSQPLIFANVDFGEYKDKVLYGLRKHYAGIESVVKLYHEDNDGKLIRAIQINVKSDKLAEQCIDQKIVHVFDKTYSLQPLSSRSLIVPKVTFAGNSEQLLQDLSHNYLGVEKIFQFYDLDRNAVNCIRIDFKSDGSVAKIIKDNYILIDGKRRPVQPYWSLIEIPTENQNGKDLVPEPSQQSVAKPPQQSVKRPQSAAKPPQQSWTKPPQKSEPKHVQNYLTEERIRELFLGQQSQLQAMIKEFENKWNARLSSLTVSSTNSNDEQFLQVVKDLSTVSQQFNQQNAQIQRQLGTVVNRVQDIQIKSDGEQTQQEWPQLPVQNGH